MRRDEAHLADIHDYDDVDLDIVWDTVQRDLPPLVIRLAAHLAANPPPTS